MWKSSLPVYRFVARSERFVRQRLTGAGMLLGCLCIAAAVIGVDTQQTVGYQVFALAFALLLVAIIGVFFQRSSFRLQRSLPRIVGAGEPFTYRMLVTNHSGVPRDGLLLFEELDQPQPDASELRARHKWPTYRTWKRHVFQRAICKVDAIPLPPIGPGSSVEVVVQAVALRRGSQYFQRSVVAFAEPLGLMRSLFRSPQPGQVLVLPKRYALPPIELPGTRQYQQGGVALASSIGHSEEFTSLRDYRPGDSLRNIHWKSFARVGEPVVREYQDEFFERHALVLDTFANPQDDPQAFEEAVSIAASLACTVSTQECLLDLLFVGTQAHCFTAGRGQMTTLGLLEVLAGVQVTCAQPFRALHDAVLARRPSLTGAICILLAWDESRASFVNDLRRSGVAVRVVVLGPSPAKPPPAWVHLIQPGRVPEGLATL